MSGDQNDYELFISYARKDNTPIPDTYPHGWVTAVKDFILVDHRQYSTDPLRIFFDTAEIKDMDDWRNRILGALRRSKVMLICLSPNYFASQPCKWEWDEFLARQSHKLVGGEPYATIYFVEVPGSDEQENAKRLEAIMGKNFTDLRPWFPNGAAAMHEEAVWARMAALGQSVWERIERARRALNVPGNLRALTPYFIGRNRELADLHRLVGVGKIGLVTAVHGLGGQGKTELSVAYARGYADSYPLGLWSLVAENRKELLPLLGELAFKVEFGYTPSEAAKIDAALAGKEVLAELQRRADAAKAEDPTRAPAALVLLDNVSDAALLSSTQLSQLPKVDWLRIIATTRLDPRPLDPAGKSIGTVPVDALDTESAVRLIENHQPGERFRNPEDEAAARAIVHELGGFTLAVEQVAVFLAVHPDVAPMEYLARLRAEGLHETDTLVDDTTVGQIEHQLKRLRPVLEAMLAPLSPAARTLVGFASLLPPDRIAWPWLKELTVARHTELGQKKPGYPDPWLALRRQVEGMRFLTGSAESNFARMHRLIGAHLRQGVTNEMDEEVLAKVDEKMKVIQQERETLRSRYVHGDAQTRGQLEDEVDVTVYPDGSFVVDVHSDEYWRSILEYVRAQLLSGKPARIVWALKTNELFYSSLCDAEQGIKEAASREGPAHLQFKMAFALHMFNMARCSCQMGNDRGPYWTLTRAVEYLLELRDRYPGEEAVSGLLKEAEELKRIYDW